MTQSVSVPTGLLTDNQRAFLRGEKDVENPDQYERNLRHRASQRVEQMAEDLAVLEEHGHDDIVAEFYYEVDRIERLRRELNTRLDDLDTDTTGENTDNE